MDPVSLAVAVQGGLSAIRPFGVRDIDETVTNLALYPYGMGVDKQSVKRVGDNEHGRPGKFWKTGNYQSGPHQTVRFDSKSYINSVRSG